MSADPAAVPVELKADRTAVTVEVKADRTTVTVGDPITLTFRVLHPQGYEIVSFDAERGLEALTLLDRAEAAPRVLENGQVEEIRTVKLAAYETGRKEIPAIAVSYRDPSGQEGRVATAPVGIDVASVLTAGQTEPADIKKPAAMPERAVWPWVVLGLLLAAAALGYFWWRRRRRRPLTERATPAAPPRAAHEIAYAELQRLLASALLERGAVKEFYIELAEIARRYLGARYGIDTFERTTGEILMALRAARVPDRAAGMAKALLSSCDLVKFARYRPDPDETRRTVESAYRLVDETKEVAAAPSEPAPASAAAGGAA